MSELKKMKYHIQRKSKHVYYSQCYWAEMKISSMRCSKLYCNYCNGVRPGQHRGDDSI